MEFTKEQLKAGQEKAYSFYSARHFKSEEYFVERLFETIKALEGLPHCPSQLLTGADKAVRGAMVSRVLKRLAQDGKVLLVAGPRGSLNYVVGV